MVDESGMIAGASQYDVQSVADDEYLTSVEIDFDGIEPQIDMAEVTVREVILAESLLTPSLQTAIKVHSYIHSLPLKWWDKLKEQNVKIRIRRPILTQFGYNDTMEVSQVVYRLGGRSSTDPNTNDNRSMINRAVEQLTFHACDRTLLNDAEALVSKSWKCTTPSDVTSYVLQSCVGARSLNIEPSDPARDYIAENIHPFQVVAQQANAALAEENDPSFVHFMTYENFGTHHFRSLKKMAKQSPIIELEYSNTGKSYQVPHSIMHYVFPCDFDVLSDKLNGIGSSSVAIFNPLTKKFSLLGNQANGCGLSEGSYKLAMSNQGSADRQNACPDFVGAYLLKRQARMGLLEKDKIALRLTVPWNTIYNVGKTIYIKLYNTEDDSRATLNYGSGKYLITALVHNIRAGGYSTITMDCVSETVKDGEV